MTGADLVREKHRYLVDRQTSRTRVYTIFFKEEVSICTFPAKKKSIPFQANYESLFRFKRITKCCRLPGRMGRSNHNHAAVYAIS